MSAARLCRDRRRAGGRPRKARGAYPPLGVAMETLGSWVSMQDRKKGDNMVNVEADRIEIGRMIKTIEDAENRRDLDRMFELLTEDAILQKCGAPQIQGLDAWREDYERFFETFISTSITSLGIEVSSSGDMAWDYGGFVSEFEGPEGRTKAEGKYLAVCKRVDGKWKTAAVSISDNG